MYLRHGYIQGLYYKTKISRYHFANMNKYQDQSEFGLRIFCPKYCQLKIFTFASVT